jgi:hypothetical protein
MLGVAYVALATSPGNVGHVVPPVPHGLRCGAATAASATIEWNVPSDTASNHLYDLEVGRTAGSAIDFPFASVTVAGTASTATIHQLKPDTEYYFKVRAHCSESGLQGCNGGDAQMISGWSNFSAAIPCKTKPSDGSAWTPPRVSPALAPLVETFWLEAYRVTENMMTFPDYLANHNSGDLDGDVAFLSGSGGTGRSNFFDFMTSPRVRYCVEIAKVDLTGKVERTPSFPPFIPINQSFSDYASCNGFGRGGAPYAPGPLDPLEWQNYTCRCDNHIDRIFAHQSTKQLCSICGACDPHDKHGFGMQCNCSDSSLAASAKYVGFMPYVLPKPNMWGPAPPPTPGPPVKPYQFGGWYHFPSAAKCPDDGTPVGTNGCTWRRDPRAYMVYGKDLLESGWNATAATGESGDTTIANNKRALQNEIGRITTQGCGN